MRVPIVPLMCDACKESPRLPGTAHCAACAQTIAELADALRKGGIGGALHSFVQNVKAHLNEHGSNPEIDAQLEKIKKLGERITKREIP